MKLIGRKHQKERLQELVNSGQSEFIAVYGRRRTGKTHLIREYFNYEFSFYASGLDDDRAIIQLSGFHASLRLSPFYEECPIPSNWVEAFSQLQDLLEKDDRKEKIVFIDELPWLETNGSDLKAGLDRFWNLWASARKDIKLIVCGSAASWMIKAFVNNNGGFYNRATEVMKIQPFNLGETKEFLLSKGIDYDDYQLVQLYMACGGIPYYLNKVKKGFSASQNIDSIFCGKTALIKNEYVLLFKSLFKNYQRHIDVIEVIYKKKKGLFRSEITNALKIKDGGNFSEILEELVSADFLTTYTLPGTTKRNAVYKIADHFILFHKNFIEKHHNISNYWINNVNTPTWYAWAGLSFELTCLIHIEQIKKALGIHMIQSSTSTWQNAKSQIDLIIDRKDQVINLLEIKFSEGKFIMTKEMEKNLINKKEEYLENYPTKKSIWFVLVSTFGLKSTANAGIFQKVVTLEDLIY